MEEEFVVKKLVVGEVGGFIVGEEGENKKRGQSEGRDLHVHRYILCVFLFRCQVCISDKK
jgi:hypothetical protein